MADLKIPNLNKNSDKFFFKKKLTLRRKSKGKLIKESFVMMFISVLIFYLNYLIPNKILVFNNLISNINFLLSNISNSLSHIYEIFLVIFIIISMILSFILFIGSLYRIMKLSRRKSRRIQFK